MDCAGAQALGDLREAPSLTSLAIGLQRNEVRDKGAEALAALKEAPSLRTLAVDLQRQKIGDSGAKALATLSHAPALTSLTLNVELSQVLHWQLLQSLCVVKMNAFWVRIWKILCCMFTICC